MSLRKVRKRFTTLARMSAVTAMAFTLASCSQNFDSKYGVTSSVRVIAHGKPVPKGGGYNKVGDPYVIAGRTYVPQENSNYRAEGLASWYGSDFHGRRTANGEVYNMHAVSAAHPTLPLPSYVRVTNLENRRSIVVRINDRGPYHNNRVIDLSVRAAKLLGFFDRGVAQVRVEYVGRAALSGSDDAKLAQTLRVDEPTAPSMRLAASEPAVPLTRLGPVTSYAPTHLPSSAISGPAGPFARPSPVTSDAPNGLHSAAIIGRGLY